MKPWLIPALASFLLGLLGSAVVGSVLVLPALSRIETTQAAIVERVRRLENGDSTPISKEARGELNAHEREIAELRREQRDGFSELRREISDLRLSLTKLRKDDSRVFAPIQPKGG